MSARGRTLQAWPSIRAYLSRRTEGLKPELLKDAQEHAKHLLKGDSSLTSVVTRDISMPFIVRVIDRTVPPTPCHFVPRAPPFLNHIPSALRRPALFTLVPHISLRNSHPFLPMPRASHKLNSADFSHFLHRLIWPLKCKQNNSRTIAYQVRILDSIGLNCS